MKRYVYAIVLLATIPLSPVQAQQTNITIVEYDQVAMWPLYPGTDHLQPDAGFFASAGVRSEVQSFTPFLPWVDFIDLKLCNASYSPTATVVILLRSQSIDGPVIASTDPVTIPPGYNNGAGSWTRFMFPSRVELKRLDTYYFEPMALSGGLIVYRTPSGNTSATLYWGTQPDRFSDMYFREGIINVYAIPEPSTMALVITSLPLFAWAVRRQTRC